MCGIAGIASFKKELSEDAIYQMTACLKQRGPDAEGYEIYPDVHLGHQRLAIIDLQQGTQPMTLKENNKTYTIIYNGELYNTLEVRGELEDLGYTFKSNSDTEVLLMAFIEWRELCVEKLNGIFAFAVYCVDEKCLFLFRDRLGVKPLFYSYNDGLLLFASEIKAILAYPNFKRSVTVEGLAVLFSMGPSRVPGKTVYANINELPAAHFVQFKEDNFQVQRYWDIVSREHQHSLQETVNNVRTLVTDAVERQLVSDVPVCTFLSGGIDSSIISKIASDKMELHTYSLDYEENTAHFKASSFQSTEDGPFVQMMVENINSQHHAVTIAQHDLVKSLKDALQAKDYPSMADIDGALLLFCGEIKKDFKVALSGECADELFGGYPWFQQDSSRFPWITSIDERSDLFKPEWREKLKLQETFAQCYEEALSNLNHLETEREKLFALNQHYFMQTLLERKDRMSMAKGLEVRVPFADHRLVEYVWNIPWEMKQYGGLEKGILRYAFKGLLPDEVLYRKKNPFPKTHHLAYTEAVRQELQARWQNPHSILRELFEETSFEALIETGGASFKKPWFGQLMTGPQLLAYFIQLDEWFDSYSIELTS